MHTAASENTERTAPVQLSGLAALRQGWRFLRDPLAASRDIHGAHGPFVTINVPLPGAKRLRLVPFGLPLMLTVGASFSREVLGNPATWRSITVFRGGAKNSAARRLADGILRMTGRRHAHYHRLLVPPL